MNELQFSNLSESEQEEIHEAKLQIVQAERYFSEVVLKHLKLEHLHENKDFTVYRFPTASSRNSLEVIRSNGDVVGIYVDPPGICVAV